MKFRNIHFLSVSNIKGNRNSGTITFLICLLVIAVTIVSSYSVVTVNVVNKYKEDYKARSLYLSPFIKPITDEALKAISSVEHVEIVADITGLPWYSVFSLTETSDAQIDEQIQSRETRIEICGLYEGEEKEVVKGETLDNSPILSCLVPSIFYPYDDDFEYGYKDLDYIDGRTLIGESITVKGDNDIIEFYHYTSSVDGRCEQILTELPSPEITLNIVGTYPCSYSTSGNFSSVIVSKETNLLILQMAMDKAGIDLFSKDSAVAQWWNTPSIHEYFVVVDDYSNLTDVFNSVRKMGYDISNSPELLQDDTTVLLANLFKFVGTFLTVAIAFISVVILVQSSVSAINERKGYIGLMKAIGYKNRQVFLTLLWEQLYMSLRAFVIGGAVSTALAYVINLYFEHGTYRQLQYVMDWNVYFVFLGVAFLIVLLVPIITELLLLKKLVKIAPRDAMATK